MHFKIVTPERVVLETEADSVTLPTALGEITLLPNHMPLVSNVVPGEIRFRRGEQEEFLAVSSGFAEFRPVNQVLILADSAEFGHEINIQRAELARQEAQRFLTEVHHDEKSMAQASAAFEKELVRIRVAQKHRTRTQPHIES
jgi:F-type H+-transporting ATPase subunit epsilon